MNLNHFTKHHTDLNLTTFHRIILLVFAAFFAVMILFDLGFKFIGLRSRRIQDIDDIAYTEVHFSDGTEKTVQSTSFPQIHYGDKAIVHIPTSKIDAHVGDQICFVFYNSLVRVYAHNHLVYSKSDQVNARNTLIGNVLCRIPISAADLKNENEMLIIISPQKHASISRLTHVRLMPSSEASLYPLINHEVDFLIFTTILVFSAFVFCLLLLFLPFGLGSLKGLALSAFCGTVSCWYLGYNDMFYILSDNEMLCTKIEYPAIYLAPVPLFAYFMLNSTTKKARRIYCIFGSASTIFFLTATILHLNCYDWNYNRLMPLLHAFIILSVASLFFVFIQAKKVHVDVDDQVMTIGIAVFSILITLQIWEMYLYQTNHAEISFLHTSYATMAILVFVIALFLNATIKYFQSRQFLVAQRQLETAAYVDVLTRIPSRYACYNELQKMSERKVTVFSVLFLDANNLKLANDKYGHEMGDKLLKFIANSISKSFNSDGFFGRWGGDEFIVCFLEPDKVDSFLKLFLHTLETESGDFEFPVTVAVGRADSTADNPLSPNDAVNTADALMYRNKRKNKKTEKSP